METPTLHGTSGSALAPKVGEPQGLLLALSSPPPGEEEEFNTWYQEHAAARLTVPGVFNARRYTALRDDGPRYMACYDMEAPETLQTPEYKRLHSEQSQYEKDMMARLALMDRRVYKLLLASPAWTKDPPFILTVALEPATGTREDFVAWYREEHIRMLLDVPGWRRARLFEQVEGHGPSFCALHELESPEVLQSEAMQKTRTPWRERVIGGVSRDERGLWKLLSTWPHAREGRV
jgi:hypothetical protein